MSGGVALLLCAMGVVHLCGQPVALPKVKAPPSPSTNAHRHAVTPREEIILTGITDLMSYRRAYFQIDGPGQPSQYRTLAEGEENGDITLLAIDSQKGKVTLRHRGAVRELRLNTRTSGPPAPSVAELQRDASHSAHHARRAQLDRAHDDQEVKD